MPQSESEQPRIDELPHSVYGIVSLNIALCFLVLPIPLLIAANAFGLDMQGMHLITALWLICMIFAEMVALTLGIIGVCQPGTRKIFPILGIVFSGIACAIPAILFIIALIIAVVTGH